MSGSVRIVTSGQTLTVNITRPDGSAATAYTDGTLSTSVAFPQTITADTSYYVTTPSALAVSAKLSGVEIASNGNTASVYLEDGQQSVIAPTSVYPTTATSTFAPLLTLDTKGPSGSTNALRYFRSQLARRESSPCDIAFVGHSLVEGEGASAITNRGTDRIRDIFRNRFPTSGVTGGYGFAAVSSNATTWTNTLVTPSGGAFSGNYGPGKHAYFVNATGAKVILNSITCTAVDVLYIQGGGGTFSTKTDGVANSDSKVTTGSPVQMMKYRVPNISGAAAPHTVEVDWVSGNSIIVGFMVYNGDETTGIRVWNDAQGGLTSTQMLDPNNQNLMDFTSIAPSLVTITALANDFKTSVPLATSRANLVSLVAQARAKAPNASIVFAIEHALGSTGATIPWSNYAALYYDVAAADGNIAVFDFYQRVGTSTPPSSSVVPGIIYTDNQHYTNAGYLMWAEAFAQFLSP